MDFKELRDNATADKLRRTIPLEIEHGQIAFSIRSRQNRTLSVRSEQISLSVGVSSTYACINCPCANSVTDGWIIPAGIDEVVGMAG